MTIIRYNNREVTLAPDLTLELQNERKLRQLADIDVVEQTSSLVTIANNRIDNLVQRMNDFESGAETGATWAQPLQKEKNDRISGDNANANKIESYNTAQTQRADGIVLELHDNTTRIKALENVQKDYVKQNGDAVLKSVTINEGGQLLAPAGKITGVFTVGQLVDRSDIPWTRVATTDNVSGQPGGVWMKKHGDTVSVMIRVISPPIATNNWKICDIPDWARLAAPNNLMFIIPAWSSESTGVAKLQIHSNDTIGDATNHDIIEILKPPINTRYETMIKYELMYNMP